MGGGEVLISSRHRLANALAGTTGTRVVATRSRNQLAANASGGDVDGDTGSGVDAVKNRDSRLVVSVLGFTKREVGTSG